MALCLGIYSKKVAAERRLISYDIHYTIIYNIHRQTKIPATGPSNRVLLVKQCVECICMIIDFFYSVRCFWRWIHDTGRCLLLVKKTRYRIPFILMNEHTHIYIYKYLHLSTFYLLTCQPLFERKEISVKWLLW